MKGVVSQFRKKKFWVGMGICKALNFEGRGTIVKSQKEILGGRKKASDDEKPRMQLETEGRTPKKTLKLVYLSTNPEDGGTGWGDLWRKVYRRGFRPINWLRSTSDPPKIT